MKKDKDKALVEYVAARVNAGHEAFYPELRWKGLLQRFKLYGDDRDTVNGCRKVARQINRKIRGAQ